MEMYSNQGIEVTDLHIGVCATIRVFRLITHAIAETSMREPNNKFNICRTPSSSCNSWRHHMLHPKYAGNCAAPTVYLWN